MHKYTGGKMKFQVENVHPNNPSHLKKIYSNDCVNNMRVVDDHDYGGDNSSSDSSEVVINQRKNLSKNKKPRSKVRLSSISSTISSSISPVSSQEDIIFGVLVAADEAVVVVTHKNQQKMSDTTTFGHGLISLIGRQRSMEDSFTVFPNLMQLTQDDKEETVTYDFFAVFDGHGGHKVSYKCRERLHQLVAEEVAARGGWKDVDWDSVMYSSFSRMDVEVAETGVVAVRGNTTRSVTKTVGSTALVVVIGKEEIVVANCGDCRAVLFRDGAPFPLSRDHKPDRPDEKQRLEAAGGNVVEDSDCSRVLGVLSTSRSIGDYNLKPYMTSEPEVQICKRKPSDEFMVIATDGLWDVLTNETACDLVRKCFNGQVSKKVLQEVHGNCSGAAATMLAELAIARGSNDNISVIVVQLQSFEASSK